METAPRALKMRQFSSAWLAGFGDWPPVIPGGCVQDQVKGADIEPAAHLFAFRGGGGEDAARSSSGLVAAPPSNREKKLSGSSKDPLPN